MIDELVQGFDAAVFCELLNAKFAGTFSPVTKPIPVDKDLPWKHAEQLGVVKTLPGANDVNMPLLVVAAELPEREELRERSSRVKQFKFAAGSGKERREHFDIKTLYRYPKEFALSEAEVLELFKGIPFLNGGLFECLDKKQNYLDGFSRSPKCAAKVPNRLFFDQDEGLIPLLRQYNFTVEENSPGDEEVALDPELLGKVFENLLAAYNPETNVQARKATGSFYTPREIVNYMVDESLIAYLLGELEPRMDANGREWDECSRRDTEAQRKENEKELRVLFAEGVRPADEELCQTMDNALVTAKILDPACGSGAFPMGMLLRMVDALRVLRGIPEDDPVYDLKLELIENCIYGADIQCIAVQISKLRFFISLVCEQKKDDPEHNYGIHSLPNLETKFVAANSLIGLPHSSEMLPMQDVEALKKQLWSIRHRHFLARSYQEKKELRKEDRKLRTELAGALELGGGFDTASAKLMAEWDPYDQNTSASFLDAEWMFNVAHGFDVVIGNPPYGRIFSKAHEVVFSKRWPAFRATKDAYVAFILQGLDSTCKGGVECFIVPSAWLGGPGYEQLRSDFLNRTVSQIISLPFDMFAAAYVDNAIILVLNARRPDGHVSQAYAYHKKAALDDFTPGPWESIEQAEWGCISGKKIVLSSSGLALQKKLQANCKRTLRDVFEMRRGVLFNKSILKEHRAGPRSFQYFAGDVYRYELNKKMGGWVTFGKGMKECPKSDKWFRGKRLLLRRLVNRRQRLMATLADADFITNKNLYSLLSKDGCPSPECLLAVVNSALMSRLYIDAVSQAAKDDFPQVTITDFLSLPLPTEIAPADESKLAILADRILAVKESDASADVAALEAEIDRLVYELYGLTPGEIAVVEESAVRSAAASGRGKTKKAGGKKPKPSSSETTPRQRKSRRKRKADLPPSLPGWD